MGMAVIARTFENSPDRGNITEGRIDRACRIHGRIGPSSPEKLHHRQKNDEQGKYPAQQQSHLSLAFH